MIITVYDSYENRYGEVDSKKVEYINIREIKIKDGLLEFESEGNEIKRLILNKSDREVKIEEVI